MQSIDINAVTCQTGLRALGTGLGSDSGVVESDTGK